MTSTALGNTTTMMVRSAAHAPSQSLWVAAAGAGVAGHAWTAAMAAATTAAVSGPQLRLTRLHQLPRDDSYTTTAVSFLRHTTLTRRSKSSLSARSRSQVSLTHPPSHCDLLLDRMVSLLFPSLPVQALSSLLLMNLDNACKMNSAFCPIYGLTWGFEFWFLTATQIC